MNKSTKTLFAFIIIGTMFSFTTRSHAEDFAKKNVVNMNLGAAVVAGMAFHRLHVPLNYQRVIRNDRSIVIGFHPAFPVDKGYSEFAFGTSFRMRYHKKNKAPTGLWVGWGIFAFYQSQKNLREDRSKLMKSYEGSMIGPLVDIGYAFYLPKARIIIEPFVGIALQLVSFKKDKTEFFNVPYPWAGFCIGYVF
jgi:hypothetical protein